MRSLWFKQCYADEVLYGTKRHTDRLEATRYRPGQTVAASVGPRTPFALLTITRLYPVPADDPETAENRALYGDAVPTRIEFEVVARYGFGHRRARDA